VNGLPPVVIQQLLASGSDGLMAFDAELRCLFWNPAMETIAGMKAADVLGQNLVELFPFLTEIEAPNLRRAAAGEEVSSRTRPFHFLGSGRQGFFDAHYRPLHDDCGLVVGAIAVVRDVTDRRQAEEQLRNQFLSVASHELRTPLTPLQLQIERLDRLLHRDRRQAVDLEEVRQLALIVKSQVARMADLVDVLLDVSRVTHGSMRLDCAELDVSDLVRQTVERWRPAAAIAGCRLDLQLDGPVLASSDRLRLEQLLDNLLSNAIKYGARKPIEVELAADPDLLRLQVRDHGIGVPLADQARIFERFERAVPVENYGGLGLGLWISRQIVDAMGGDIRVESAPEKGARFLVELPRTKAGNGVRG
jgi:PAS domain S-box-containing protein